MKTARDKKDDEKNIQNKFFKSFIASRIIKRWRITKDEKESFYDSFIFKRRLFCVKRTKIERDLME
jgi:hypothetical protein